MKAPENFQLLVRCPSNKGCTLAYVVNGKATVAEALLVLRMRDSQPVAQQSRAKESSGFPTYDLREESQDPTSLTVACRCSDWDFNTGKLAAMVDAGITGEVIHDGRAIPRRPTVAYTV